MSGLDYERVVLSGGPVGIAAGVHGAVVPYIHDRRQFGQSIGESAGPGKVADMSTPPSTPAAPTCTPWPPPATAARRPAKDAAGVILYSAERATQMALDAIQILGGNGYINEFPPAACCATPSSTRSAPAPARSAAC